MLTIKKHLSAGIALLFLFMFAGFKGKPDKAHELRCYLSVKDFTTEKKLPGVSITVYKDGALERVIAANPNIDSLV